MIIKSIHVKHFRCILSETLNCEPLTAIVGANGVGKSSFLRALELFYASSPRFGQDDFYNKEIDEDIEITVTFADLEEDARNKFGPYLDGEELTVTRALSLHDDRPSAKFYGAKLQNKDFAMVREAGSAMAVREKYGELKQKPEYSGLPTANSQVAVLEAMRKWELDHLEQCTRQRDDGQFFGFAEVAQGYLGQFTRLISIPAVRDAAEDATEGKGHPITEMLDMVIRATLANHSELKELREQTQKQYEQVMATGATSELGELEGKLTSTLTTYVPDAAVKLQWITEGGVEIAMPKAEVRLVEHGYPTGVVRAGHGLQRAFIMTMLQHLAAIQIETSNEEGAERIASADQQGTPARPLLVIPSLVLLIEEPELYQHPSRQRHLSNLLLKLASGTVAGVAKRTQVIYSTHSPLFVGIDRFNQIRVLKKILNGPDKPKIAKVVEVKGDVVAMELWEACERKDRNDKPVPSYTWSTLQPRLQAIMTPWMAEGFFADVAVLVEGEDDRAAILGAALNKDHDFESQGIAVIPVGGKNSLDRPCLIFKKFGIPVYTIWDNDKNNKDAKPRENQILLRIVGGQSCDWPCGVYEKYACFENKLEDTVRSEIGQATFDSILEELREELGYSNREDAVKNPTLFGRLLRKARDQGAPCTTLDATIESIVKLKA